MNPILFLLLMSFHPGSSPNPVDVSGQIITLESFPSRYIDPRTIRIWLPPDYSPEKNYSVLYMQDGQMAFDSLSSWNQQSWHIDRTAATMITSHQIKNVIIVAINNHPAFRNAEYFPEKIFESIPAEHQEPLVRLWLQDKPRSDAYLKFLTTELKPFIDHTYPTLPGRKYTFVMGASMGGIISLYAICEYPSVFGGAACLSTHWPLRVPPQSAQETASFDLPSTFIHYLQSHLPNHSTHRIYFDHGTQTLDELYAPYQEKVDLIMRQKGFDQSHWISRVFEGADHSENSWAKRVDIPLQFLLGQED